jgi:outer membrane protein assembly factor BamB
VLLTLHSGTSEGAPARDKAPSVLPFFPVNVVWQLALGAPPDGAPTRDDERLFVPLRTGSLVAISARNGSLLWTARLDAQGPIAADGTRLFVPTDGALEALDPATGEALWRAPLASGPVAGVSAIAGWVFLLHEDGTLEARRAATGERIWQRSTPAPVTAGPHVMAEFLFVGMSDGTAGAFRVTDGERVWVTRVEGAPSALTASPERLYFGTRSKFFYCLETRSGRIDWRWRIGAEIVGAPTLDEQHVYLVALDNQIRALDRNNGAQRWRKPLAARPIGSAVHVGASVVPASLAAELRGFAVKDGASQGRYPTSHELAAVPVVIPLPYTRGGEVIVAILADGSTLALQRGVEPAIVPLPALIGTPVALTPARPTPPAPASLH